MDRYSDGSTQPERAQMRLAIILTMTIALTSCATEHLVITDSTGTQWPVIYDSSHSTMQVTINGKSYSGHYVNNSASSTGFITSFSFGPFMYGYGPGLGTFHSYNPGNTGRALLLDKAGDTLDCHYNYQGTTVVGTCRDKSGNKYAITSQVESISHQPGINNRGKE